jgi:mono/diheme cytochrome c family protein
MNLARLAGRIDTIMEDHLHSVEQRLDASFVAFGTQILQSDRETRDAVLAIARRESAQVERNLKNDMAAMETRLRAEIAAMGETLRGEMAAMETRLRAETAAMGETLRGEMADMEARLRAEIAVMGETLRGEIAAMATTLRGEMADMEERLREEMHTLHGIAMRRIDRLETTMVDGLGETRRFMQVLHEETLSRITLLAEGRAPLN